MEHIKTRLKEFFSDINVAGMSVAITDRQGIVFSENFGTLNAEIENSKTPEGALYRIASVSKVITGLTLMKLVDDNILKLDTPIKEYIPNLKMSIKATEESVTLRHLLSHTSGLPAEYEPDGPRDESALEKSVENELPHIKLMSAPEEKHYCYSNWGIRLASYVAQSVTGEYFSQLAERLIIKPLNMKLTTYDPLVALTYPVSLPHIYSDGAYSVVHKINENAGRYAAGGLFSNTEDLCKLARLILNDGKTDNGVQVISKSSIKEMFSQQAVCNNDYYGYGLTSMLFEREGIRATGHLGSHPPYATSLITEKTSGYGIITLMNTYSEKSRLDIPFNILRELI